MSIDVKPPKPAKEVPHWLAVTLAAKRAAMESLTPEERAEAAASQKEWREKRRVAKLARKEAQRTQLGFVLKMWCEGETVAEIAGALNRHVEFVYRLYREYGLQSDVTVARRWRRFWLKAADDLALHRLAHDAGLSVPAMLDQIGSVMLADDAHVARRTLKIQRKAEKA